MIRARFIGEVRYGHWAENLKAAQRLNEIAQARGWAVATLWTPAVGRANEFVAEVDYPDLATYEWEGEEQHLMRSGWRSSAAPSTYSSRAPLVARSFRRPRHPPSSRQALAVCGT